MNLSSAEKQELLTTSNQHYQIVTEVAEYLGDLRNERLKEEYGEKYAGVRFASDVEYRDQRKSNFTRHVFSVSDANTKSKFKDWRSRDLKVDQGNFELAWMLSRPPVNSKGILQHHLDPYELTLLSLTIQEVKKGVPTKDINVDKILENIGKLQESDQMLEKGKTIKVGLEAELLVPDQYDQLTDITDYPEMHKKLIEVFGDEDSVPEDFKKVLDVKKMEKYIEATEALGHLGFKVFNQGVRELILEDGSDIKNIRAVQHLSELGIFRPDQDINFHVNISGIENPENYVADLFLLHIISCSLNYFSEHDLVTELTQNSIKPFFQHLSDPGEKISGEVRKSSMPKGLPLLIRPSGVIEFRHIAPHWEGYEVFSSGLLSFTKLTEGLAAYSRVKEKKSDDPIDIQLAAEWENYRSAVFNAVDNQLLDPTTGNTISPGIQKLLQTFQSYSEVAKITAEYNTSIANNRESKLVPIHTFEEVVQKKRDFLANYIDRDLASLDDSQINELFNDIRDRFTDPEWYWEIDRLILRNVHGDNKNLHDTLERLTLEVIDTVKSTRDIKV